MKKTVTFFKKHFTTSSSHFLHLCTVAFFVCTTFGFAQTNPTAQALPYNQNFGTATFNTMPIGMAAWSNNTNTTTQATAEAALPALNAAVTAAASPITTGGIYGYAASSNARVYLQQSSNAANGTNTVVAAINTGTATAINIAYQLEQINAGASTQDYGIGLQYRLGTSGAFTTVPSSAFLTGNSFVTQTFNYTISGDRKSVV